ncbi:hypothetical protein [Candidatus Synechococcus spongiarum]|uniref:hypothetical protein n=1 Tax=Candidatus Synechococcus spongiarum TaxID=431041 RepID=UPI001177A25A|nr:hypothetical protein [Candidatus Synechococcus spongiarum]
MSSSPSSNRETSEKDWKHVPASSRLPVSTRLLKSPINLEVAFSEVSRFIRSMGRHLHKMTSSLTPPQQETAKPGSTKESFSTWGDVLGFFFNKTMPRIVGTLLQAVTCLFSNPLILTIFVILIALFFIWNFYLEPAINMFIDWVSSPVRFFKDHVSGITHTLRDGLVWIGHGIAHGASFVDHGLGGGAQALGHGAVWIGRGIGHGASFIGHGLGGGAQVLGHGAAWIGHGIGHGASFVGHGLGGGAQALGHGAVWIGHGIGHGASLHWPWPR